MKNSVRHFTGEAFSAAERFPVAPGLAALEPGVLARQRAEGHVAWLDASGLVLARVSWWFREAPSREGKRIGAIGHFAAVDAAATRAVLEAACATLSARGATLVVGPMDGNTWRRYRFVVEGGDEPPFLLEPWNPPEYPTWWEAAGFAPLARYQSAAITELTATDPRYARVQERLLATGLRIRTIDIANFETDLRAIHEVSLVSFAHNFLYTPLPAEEFLAQYRPYRDKVRPEFVFLVEEAATRRCVGFMFSLPDYAQTQRGQPIDTLILKTAAVLPGRAYAGIGGLLAEMTHHAAAAAGFRRVLHALAFDENAVTNITARYGQVMRRYVLFTRRIGGL